MIKSLIINFSALGHLLMYLLSFVAFYTFFVKEYQATPSFLNYSLCFIFVIIIWMLQALPKYAEKNTLKTYRLFINRLGFFRSFFSLFLHALFFLALLLVLLPNGPTTITHNTWCLLIICLTIFHIMELTCEAYDENQNTFLVYKRIWGDWGYFILILLSALLFTLSFKELDFPTDKLLFAMMLFSHVFMVVLTLNLVLLKRAQINTLWQKLGLIYANFNFFTLSIYFL